MSAEEPENMDPIVLNQLCDNLNNNLIVSSTRRSRRGPPRSTPQRVETPEVKPKNDYMYFDTSPGCTVAISESYLAMNKVTQLLLADLTSDNLEEVLSELTSYNLSENDRKAEGAIAALIEAGASSEELSKLVVTICKKIIGKEAADNPLEISPFLTKLTNFISNDYRIILNGFLKSKESDGIREIEKWRQLNCGNVVLIGRLYAEKLVSEALVKRCLIDLFKASEKSNNESYVKEEEDVIKNGMELLILVGSRLDEKFVKDILKRLHSCSKFFSPIPKAKFLELLTLKKNNWNPIVSAPQ